MLYWSTEENFKEGVKYYRSFGDIKEDAIPRLPKKVMTKIKERGAGSLKPDFRKYNFPSVVLSRLWADFIASYYVIKRYRVR